MEAISPRIFPPPDQQHVAAQRRRIFQLHRLVWEFTWGPMRAASRAELAAGVGFDPVGPLDALRVCGRYLCQIEFMGIFEPLLFRIDGVDGKEYLVGYDWLGLGFRVFASRGRTHVLSLVDDRTGGQDSLNRIYQEEPETLEEVVLPTASVDRAFLVGMSMVIGLMEPQGDDEDERLLPLLQAIAATGEELDTIVRTQPSPHIQLDDEDVF